VIEFAVKAPTIPIPFQKLLKVVAIVLKELQRLCLRASSFPEPAMSPKDAYEALWRTRWTMCPWRASRAASRRCSP
jgi:hypothetical protein